MIPRTLNCVRGADYNRDGDSVAERRSTAECPATLRQAWRGEGSCRDYQSVSWALSFHVEKYSIRVV